MDYYPSLLLIHARQVRGVSGLDADELREIATAHWPSMGAESIDRIVERAIEQRDAGQRRIDPKTVDLKHPSVREQEKMGLTNASRERLTEWTRQAVADHTDPAAEGVGAEMHRQAQSELGIHLSYSSFRYTYFMPALEALGAQPSTNGNGAKPKPSNEGGDQHAEAVVEADIEEAEETIDRGRAAAQGSGIAEPEQDPAPDAAPAGDSARDRLRKYARAYIAFSLVQDRDLDDPVRTTVRGELYDLEEQLIAELTANAVSADVEKRATELDQLAHTLRQRTEGLLNALSREGAEA